MPATPRESALYGVKLRQLVHNAVPSLRRTNEAVKHFALKVRQPPKPFPKHPVADKQAVHLLPAVQPPLKPAVKGQKVCRTGKEVVPKDNKKRELPPVTDKVPKKAAPKLLRKPKKHLHVAAPHLPLVTAPLKPKPASHRLYKKPPPPPPLKKKRRPKGVVQPQLKPPKQNAKKLFPPVQRQFEPFLQPPKLKPRERHGPQPDYPPQQKDLLPPMKLNRPKKHFIQVPAPSPKFCPISGRLFQKVCRTLHPP